MPAYRKVYNAISKCMFALHCVYFVFVAVSLFLPFFDDGSSLAKGYCNGWTVIIPLLSLGFLGFSAWCAFKCPESPLLALGTGTFVYIGYMIMYVIPITGLALGAMLDGVEIAANLFSRLPENVFFTVLNIDVLFTAYSIITFVLGHVKPTKRGL